MKVKLIIGLGNPGKEYEKTYHNVGFLAIDYLTKNHPISLHTRDLPDGDKLIKSEVFMNQSGGFTKKALKKYKIKPEKLIIIHDDSDIELGKYKVSFGRGSAGHRGIDSIIKSLGTKNFWRLRIGIRRRNTQKDTQNYAEKQRRVISQRKASEIVLKKISKHDLEILEKVFEKIANFIFQKSL